MKTRAFKKVVSIVCVLAMLLSICVIGFSGAVSAAESYTFNTNGVEEIKQYEVGDTLHTPTTSTPGVSFEGWYPSIEDFSNPDKKVTVAGDAKKLYAKYSGLVINADVEGWKFNPNNQESYITAKDPTDSSNNVIQYNPAKRGGNLNFAFPVYQGMADKGFEYKPNTKYEISYRYFCEDLTGGEPSIDMMASTSAGIGQSGGKTDISETVTGPSANEDRTWVYSAVTFTTPETIPTDGNGKYLIICNYLSPSSTGNIYYDDIVLTEVAEKEYTLSDNGVVTKYNYIAGDELPINKDRYFLGWYDETLTVKYTKVPAGVTKLFAKYSKGFVDFESGANAIYNPNNSLQFSVVEDPADVKNHAFKVSLGNDKSLGFSLKGAINSNVGYKLIAGNLYKVTFKYKVSGLVAGKTASWSLYTTTKEGIGVDGNKSEIADTCTNITKNNDSWEYGEVVFTAPIGKPDGQDILYFTCYGAADVDAQLYIDDFTVVPYTAPVDTDDVTMDFEDDFKWSVDKANDFATGRGNGYVTRGDIIKEENGNHYFRIRHFSSKNSYHYFTVNDGTNQFTTFHYGIYTVEFDYKVEHAETPSKIGIALVKPGESISDARFKELTIVDEYSENAVGYSREDADWKHATYTFGCDLTDIEKYTSIAIFVHNSTAVPEYDGDTLVCTSVAFDNVVVKTHAATDDKGLIVFNSAGGTNFPSIVAAAERPIGVLPIPEKYGYVFKGWKYMDGGVEKDFTKDTLVPYFYTEVYAAWELAEGVIELNFRTNVPEYDANVGSIVAFPGKEILAFPKVAPTATGNTFVGWYYDTGFNNPVDPKCAPDSSATVYAKWESQGTLITFDNYPKSLFNKNTGYGLLGAVTDRIKIETLPDGNNVLYYNYDVGTSDNTSSIAAAILHTGEGYVPTVEGMRYTVSFKYKILEAKAQGVIGSCISATSNLWTFRKEQTERITYGGPSNDWIQASYTFTATFNNSQGATGSNNCFLSIGLSNDCKAYIDDVVVTSNFNTFNVYGSAVIFDTQGGKEMNPMSGDPGTKMNLPTPVKPGYKFMGWYTDPDLNNALASDAVFGDETIRLYAKWMLGKFAEGFEEYPNSVKSLGIAGAYSFYTKTSAGFDKSNIRSGETSLFRNGTSAGVKNFTVSRSADLAITPGEIYTIDFYVKPTAIGDANGTISLIGMGTFTGINTATDNVVISKVGELKEGEWNHVSYTFTAKTKFIGLSTTANNDMYFDDITVTLKGYTGSASTGDASVNPIVVLAIIIVCAGALLITGKKVFSK